MKTKIISVALAITAFLGGVAPAFASEIPSGYVLVPMANFGLPEATSSTTAATTVAISPTKSSLRAGSDVSTAGVDDIRITATLRDESGRPVASQKVSLVSSRADDVIAAISSTTNANGEAVFAVRGGSEGMSTFTGISADGTAIAERPKIVFLKNDGTSSPLAAGLLSADTLESDATVAAAATYSEFFDVTVPSALRVGQPSDLVVRVTDTNGTTSEDFVGTIAFQSGDSEAILPADYTFTTIDRGEHTFANALTFGKAGVQRVTISTLDSSVEPIEFSVEVLATDGGDGAPEISSPPNNAVLNSSAVDILGTTEANSNLAIVVDDSVVSNAGSEVDGSFYAPITLADGEHEIKVGLLDATSSVSALSDPLTLTIDTTPPELINFEVLPQASVTSGTEIFILAESESGLSQAAVVNGGGQLPLTEITTGQYSASFVVENTGEFPLDIKLVDAAGNETLVEKVETVLVGLEQTIFDLAGEGGNNLVDLSWGEPVNLAEVDHFRVLVGTDPENLDGVFETNDAALGAAVTPLENGVEYFFQVFSIDPAGTENGFSEVVSATPALEQTIFDVETTPKNARVDLVWAPPANHADVDHYQIFYGTNPDSLDQVFETVDNRTGWYVGGLQNDTVYFFQIVSLDSAGTINGFSEAVSETPTDLLGLISTSCDSRIRLAWRANTNPAIINWQIAYGIRSGSPTESRVLPDGADRTEWEIRDLVNGVQYFITLVGLDSAGQQVFVSDEVVATPIAGACHTAAAVETPTETPLQLWVREDENKQKMLVWNPDPAASAYKIYAGTAPNFFDLPTVVVNTPYFRPEGLLANEDYFFAVRAVYADGSEAVSTSNVAKLEVGPLATLFAAIALALGGAMLIHRRKILGKSNLTKQKRAFKILD